LGGEWRTYHIRPPILQLNCNTIFYITRIIMQSGITRLSLANGLLVLLKEIHTAPMVSHWIWYRVGSRDERPAITGISHWVEHMQFKGTPTFPGGILDKAISREGGVWNAFTHLDWTTYFETLPSASIDLALKLEADRMTHSLFVPSDVEAERTVIISERQGGENEPQFLLNEEVQAAAFRVHSYHHEVIGDMADLQTMTREDLYQHYQAYYTPNNAVLAVAGDFDTKTILERIKELYGEIPARNQPPRLNRPEPEQHGERQVKVEGPGETTYVQISHHVPDANHPDFFPLTVLDSLLTGASSLNMFGSGISNKTSRLYQALVESEKAVSVYGGLSATLDPFLHSIYFILHPQARLEEALQITQDEITRLQDAPPPAQELERAVKQAKALFAYGSESISNQAFWLGFSEMFATYEWFTTYLDKLASVMPEDVQRAAQTYLRPQNRILGIYLPGESKEEEDT
jgi:zinc protease